MRKSKDMRRPRSQVGGDGEYPRKASTKGENAKKKAGKKKVRTPVKKGGGAYLNQNRGGQRIGIRDVKKEVGTKEGAGQNGARKEKPGQGGKDVPQIERRERKKYKFL